VGRLEIFLLISAFVFMAIIVEIVRRRRLAENFAILWLGVALGVVVLGIARPVVDWISQAVGVEYGTSLFFGAAIAFFVFVCISLSIHISRLESRVESLAEEVAMLKGPRRAPPDHPSPADPASPSALPPGTTGPEEPT
jgi:hypothetical protein